MASDAESRGNLILLIYMQNSTILESLGSSTGWFEKTLVANTKDRVSRVEAHIRMLFPCRSYGMRESRGWTGGPEPPPPPLKNHKNLGFLSNAGPD